MTIVPFLIAGFLLINTLLAWVFHRYRIQTEKLQFWVMVTSGAAWLIALVYFLLIPRDKPPPAPLSPEDFLPKLEFTQDWISAALLFAIVGLIFITVLRRQENPQSNAWLAGLGGACVIGLEANSAYSLGLIWTVVEAIHLYFSYREQQLSSSLQHYLPVVLLRLTAPSILILVSLTLPGLENSIAFSRLGSGVGLLLIGAGLLGFLGWFLFSNGLEHDQGERYLGAEKRWIPAILGLSLIIRGGSLLDATNVQPAIPLILSSVLIATAMIGLLLGRSSRLWFLSCSLLVSIAAILSGAEAALIWGLVMILPGLQLWRISNQSEMPLLLVVTALIGLLPVPYLPSWVGVTAFGSGVSGMFLGISYGILLGGLLIKLLKSWQSSGEGLNSPPLMEIIGAGVILLSQVVISLRLDLITASQDILSKPVMLWISIVGVLPVLLLGNHFPLKRTTRVLAGLERLRVGIEKILTASIHAMDRLVDLISRVFEGQGGLIWTLLIGLLLISLISLGGG